MPITKSILNADERARLLSAVQKNKIYPFRYRFNKAINATNFATADGSIGSYFTLSFTPGEIMPIITLATGFIVTPNMTADIFSLAVSYRSTWTWGDNASASQADDEGNDIYSLISNGGAINDFQVFYPTDWYVERKKTIYIHVYAGATTITAATSSIVGHIILGTLPTGA